MKIGCYFSGKTKLGGAERRLTRIFDALSVDESFEVTFVLRKYEQPVNVVKVYHSFSNIGNIKYHFVNDSNVELFNFVRKERFDAVVFIGPYRAMMPFVIAGKISGARCIWLLVNTSLASYKFDNIGQRVLFNLCARLADNIDCLFPASASIVKKHVKKPECVSITPCAFTNLDEFKSVEKNKSFVFLSRLVKGKNVELFFDAVILIKSFLQENGYKVVIAGDGELKPLIEDKVKKDNLGDLVSLPGYVDSKDYFPQADVFLSLQNINNYPSQSLLEAISCGCYIIATDIGDTRTIVRPQFGSLCGYNAREIADLMIDFVNKEFKDKLKIQQEARAFAENTFIIERSVEHYRGLLLHKEEFVDG